MTIEVQEPLLKTVGRRMYEKRDGSATPMLVYLLENGRMLNHLTMEEFIPTEEWFHVGTVSGNAVYVLMLKWSDPKWGEECIALFGSAEDARRFAEERNIGRYFEQKVRLVR